jgi:hypothetical protein
MGKKMVYSTLSPKVLSLYQIVDHFSIFRYIYFEVYTMSRYC